MTAQTALTGLKRSFRRGGVKGTARALVSWTTHRVQKAVGVERDALQRRRAVLAREIDRQLGSVVRYGPFKGLRLTSSNWGSDRASMLLGFYEKELLDFFVTLPDGYDVLIDLGAADGYYAIGTLLGGQMSKSICFEIQEAGREAIRDNAEANGVADKVKILGEATPGFAETVSQEERARTVVLVDIEGAEFDLLQASEFEALAQSIFVIEVHRWAKGDREGLEELVARSSNTHDARVIRTGARDLSGLPELEELEDNDRWLLCSEGRRRLGTWLILTPRANGTSAT